MRIVSWNVNSLRVRLDQVERFLREQQPDVLALQETKSQDPEFPAEVFERLGYRSFCSGQKTYNGVALTYARALLNELDARGLELPVLIGGRLNQIPDQTNSSLPVDVTTQLGGNDDVLKRSQRRNELEILEHEPNMLIADCCELIFIES